MFLSFAYLLLTTKLFFVQLVFSEPGRRLQNVSTFLSLIGMLGWDYIFLGKKGLMGSTPILAT